MTKFVKCFFCNITIFCSSVPSVANSFDAQTGQISETNHSLSNRKGTFLSACCLYRAGIPCLSLRESRVHVLP